MADDLKELEEQISERKSQQEVTTVLDTEMKMPNLVPELNKNKDLEEQASDVVRLIGAQKASQNESFMQKVADNFATGVLTEQETKQMKNEMLKAEQYFNKWKKVLKLVHTTEAQGLGLMRIIVCVMIVPYFILCLIGFFFMCTSEIFEFFNTLFNAVFGNGGEILTDNAGNPVINTSTNKPYRKKSGYNLFAKILLGTIIVSIFLALAFGIIYVFTGFNIFEALRRLFQT